MHLQTPAFADFIAALARLPLAGRAAPAPCPDIVPRLAALVADDGWLPGDFREPSDQHYLRRCLYQAPDRAFSVGCFVWAPHQKTPVHDHRSWGVIGVLAGSITSETYRREGGRLAGAPPVQLQSGLCAWVHPELGDIHRVGGGPEGGISIHVYGCAFDAVCLNLYD